MTSKPLDIPEPSLDRVFCKKFHTVYAVKGLWSLRKELLLNKEKYKEDEQMKMVVKNLKKARMCFAIDV